MNMQLQLLIVAFWVASTVLGFPESRTSQSAQMPQQNTFPLYGLTPNFNDIFERLRQQFAYLANAVPASGGNTTTITKEINGHQVVVNETVYTNGPGFEFHVRVIDIKPEESHQGFPVKEEVIQDNSDHNSFAPDTKSKRRIGSAELLDRESIETYSGPVYNNYIRTRNKPTKYNSVESLEEIAYNGDNIETFDEMDHNIETFDDNLESPETGNNNIELVDDINRVVDLSHDIYVNEIAAKQNWKPNPNAEVFASYPRNTYASRPIQHDLSRDTYINDLAAETGHVQPHPDTELLPISRFYYRPARSS